MLKTCLVPAGDSVLISLVCVSSLKLDNGHLNLRFVYDEFTLIF